MQDARRRWHGFATYEAGVFEACCNFWGKIRRDLRMSGGGRSLVIQRRMMAVRHLDRAGFLDRV